jgi:hypothetical protein
MVALTLHIMQLVFSDLHMMPVSYYSDFFHSRLKVLLLQQLVLQQRV